MSAWQLRSRKRLATVANDTPAIASRFAPVFSILKPLTLGRDAMVFSVTGTFIQSELTSGRFDSSSRVPLSAAFEPLSRALSLKIGSAAVVEISDEARSRLKLPDFPDGSLALICLEATPQVLVCAAIFESRQNGSLSADAIQALQATARLGAGIQISTPPSTELAELRNFYRRFSQALRQCFWVSDLESGRVLTVSENFEDVWGAKRSILTTGPTGFMANILPEDRDRVLSDFHTSLESELDLEFRVFAEDAVADPIRWMRLRVTLFGDERLLMIAEDISKKKKVEELERAREVSIVAQARALAVVDLASGVAHEINNPLTIIVGRASELKRRALAGPLDAGTMIEFTDKIQSTALRIADIVKSLKSLARQDRGQGFTSVSFATIASEVMDLSSERFRSQGVDLRIESPVRPLSADINSTLISQAILNLVNNALDAVSNLSDKWVSVDFTEDDDSVYIGITDSGAGIPINIRSRIFDPFFTTKSPGKGTGLGLSLSMNIAAHHDGALRLDTLHENTRFVLQLPKHNRRNKLKR